MRRDWAKIIIIIIGRRRRVACNCGALLEPGEKKLTQKKVNGTGGGGGGELMKLEPVWVAIVRAHPGATHPHRARGRAILLG